MAGRYAARQRSANEAASIWTPRPPASAELFRHYKPDPEPYLGAAGLLSLAPAEVMVVAAHNDDLIAAGSLGLATAFVPRPGDLGPNHQANREPARPYTCVAADFGDLADQLGT